MPSAESIQSERSKIIGNLIPILISLTALTVTFLISVLDLSFSSKLLVFISIISFYIVLVAGFYFIRRRHSAAATVLESRKVFDEVLEDRLLALEEAHQFFSASLKPADMFRFAASRLNEIVPFAACVLFAVNFDKSSLKVQFAVGENMQEFDGLKISAGNGLAGQALATGRSQTTDDLFEDRQVFSAKTLDKLECGIAAPLFQNAEVFGVLVLYGDSKNQFSGKSKDLLEAVAVRVAPLLLSSQAFENNLANALTDSLTALPNERAFHLILENQIAEAQRFRNDRSLTIITFDIKNFKEINRNYGHAAGDRILKFVADKIKSQLRQMDFLARSTADEFCAVLPTASEEITREIIERVRKTFVLNPFEISKQENLYVQLNFGTASFWKDGEIAPALIERALLKKSASKNTDGKNGVLFFPKEFVN